MVAVDAEERRGVMVRAASAIKPDWLIELYAERLKESRSWIWNPEGERVDLVEKLSYDQLTLDEKRAPAPPGEEASRVLYEQALPRAHALIEGGALERIAFVRLHFPDAGLPEVTVETALARLCQGRTRLDELGGGGDALVDALDGKQRRELAELARRA